MSLVNQFLIWFVLLPWYDHVLLGMAIGSALTFLIARCCR